jgi:hypothetical protein
LKAKVRDQNGRIQEILESNGNERYININNRKPIFGQTNYDDEIIAGDNAEIRVLIFDPDFDNVQVYLTRKNDEVSEKFLFEKYEFDGILNETCGSYKLSLDTSKYRNNLGLHQFIITATDGDDEITKDIEIDIYSFVKNRSKPSIDTLWTIGAGIVGAFVTFAVGISIGIRLSGKTKDYGLLHTMKINKFVSREYKRGTKKRSVRQKK